MRRDDASLPRKLRQADGGGLIHREAEQKLRAEQDRHRHTRDELAKSKNALQFVKTQALVRSSAISAWMSQYLDH